MIREMSGWSENMVALLMRRLFWYINAVVYVYILKVGAHFLAKCCLRPQPPPLLFSQRRPLIFPWLGRMFLPHRAYFNTQGNPPCYQRQGSSLFSVTSSPWVYVRGWLLRGREKESVWEREGKRWRLRYTRAHQRREQSGSVLSVMLQRYQNTQKTILNPALPQQVDVWFCRNWIKWHLTGAPGCSLRLVCEDERKHVGAYLYLADLLLTGSDSRARKSRPAQGS